MKVGIIGCGKIAQIRHIPEYFANPNAVIIRYYDFIYERAENMANQYGGGAFTSVEELEKFIYINIRNADNQHYL